MSLRSNFKSPSYYHCLRAYDNSIHYGIVRTLHVYYYVLYNVITDYVHTINDNYPASVPFVL